MQVTSYNQKVYEINEKPNANRDLSLHTCSKDSQSAIVDDVYPVRSTWQLRAVGCDSDMNVTENLT